MDGVYYVHLEFITMEQLEAEIDPLAQAPGIVFDLRIGPNGNHEILSHLLTRPDVAQIPEPTSCTTIFTGGVSPGSTARAFT